MKKGLLSLMAISFLFFFLAEISYGWQGRMAGMRDPYSLVEDESDFLIHPARILNGEGVKFYGNYHYTYKDIKDWDVDLKNFFPSAGGGGLTESWHFETSGNQQDHEISIGSTSPFKHGRMGVFFSYNGLRGDYDGNEADNWFGTIDYWTYDIDNHSDDFSLRIIYGLPIKDMQMGLELGVAYKDEEKDTWVNINNLAIGTQNYIWTWNNPEVSLFPFLIPYKSNYWESQFKLGITKRSDSVHISGTLRGGYIISSENSYAYKLQAPVGDNDINVDINGDLDGYNIGAELWAKFPLKSGFNLPFVFSIDYVQKHRDGNGMGTGTADTGQSYRYEHDEKSFKLRGGGGIEKKLDKNTLIGAGLYYNYLQTEDDIWFERAGVRNENNKFPLRKDHQVLLKLAGEKDFSSTTTLRAGLDLFYSWVEEDFEHSWPSLLNEEISIDGNRWGISASVGGTKKFQQFTFEPFFNCGYQELDLSGDDGKTIILGQLRTENKMGKERREWFVSLGFSVLIDK